MSAGAATFTSMQNIKLLDFTAKWCGPCRQMEPVLASIAKEYGARVEIVPIDVDEDPLAAQRYNVRSMPTFVLERDGREVGRFVGSRPRSFVVGVIDRVLDGDSAVTSP